MEHWERQLQLASKSYHTAILHKILAVSGKIPVSVPDFDFVLNCSEQELRMIALAACARQRWIEAESAVIPEPKAGGLST